MSEEEIKHTLYLPEIKEKDVESLPLTLVS